MQLVQIFSKFSIQHSIFKNFWLQANDDDELGGQKNFSKIAKKYNLLRKEFVCYLVCDICSVKKSGTLS